MAKFYDEIPEWLIEWIQKQHIFWVASAPLSIHGHVNVSPKGTADSLHVVNSKQVWYEDLSGSGIETIAHLRENGRITVMFSAFEGPPRILRLFGIGTVHEYGTPQYNTLISAETRKPGSRAAIVVDVYQVSTVRIQPDRILQKGLLTISCGYAVPLYDFVAHRTQLLRAFDKFETNDRLLAASNPSCDTTGQKEQDVSSSRMTLRAYWLLKNMRSLDALPGLVTAPDAIFSMTPQGYFDKDTRPMMRHREEKLNGLQRLVFGDCAGFVPGFISGAIAILALVTISRKLKW